MTSSSHTFPSFAAAGRDGLGTLLPDTGVASATEAGRLKMLAAAGRGVATLDDVPDV